MLLYSLNEPRIPDPSSNDDTSGLEIHRYTLLGDWDPLFVALVKERCLDDDLNLETDLFPQFRTHLHRGISTNDHIIKSIFDIHKLIPLELATQFESKH